MKKGSEEPLIASETLVAGNDHPAGKRRAV
jgi:hypothetical protein